MLRVLRLMTGTVVKISPRDLPTHAPGQPWPDGLKSARHPAWVAGRLACYRVDPRNGVVNCL